MGLSASETPRDISFCGHAILGDDIFVIQNALEDERFADNPLVTGPPDIRFYAGCPLTLSNYKLGTLCIIDTKPREFTAEDLGSLRDLADMVEQELKSLQMATTDDLTRLPNRRGFISLATQALNLCQRQNQTASMLFFDLNHFKYINDNFGHAEGDRVLQLFANSLTETFRDSDICARLGGDEFVVLQCDCNEQKSHDSLKRLMAHVSETNEYQLSDYEIHFSSGAYPITQDDMNTPIAQLLHSADELMYQDKNKNR
jgi:diguanylate cyclase (GGDEF)-like protein